MAKVKRAPQAACILNLLYSDYYRRGLPIYTAAYILDCNVESVRRAVVELRRKGVNIGFAKRGEGIYRLGSPSAQA